MTEEFQERSDNELTDQDPPDTSARSTDASEDPSTVLELFGVELKVRNQRLAEVLKMSAKDALVSDVKDLADGTAARQRAGEAAEAMPDVLITPSTPHDEVQASERAEMRSRVSALGGALGFDVEPNGVWTSTSGISIVTRVVDRELSPAAAADLVAKVDGIRSALIGTISSALYITEDKDGAGVVSRAIMERGLSSQARAIALEDLEFTRSLCVAQTLDHHGVLVLLTPAADADVGDLLSIIRAAAG